MAALGLTSEVQSQESATSCNVDMDQESGANNQQEYANH